MAERIVVIKMKPGLQARQAALFVQEANRYEADIFLKKDEPQVNAKSIMGVMMLAAAKGSMLTLDATGEDETEAIQGLTTLINDYFGEGE